jgi:peptidyl-prolyl cis-trans isomerase A (cyclophilin A)
MTDLPHRRAILAGGLAMASAGPALAQTSPDPALVRVALKTTKGVITLDLNAGKAPITTRNFLHYVDLKLYDRSSFYRVSHVPNQLEHGLLEGGLQGDRTKVLKPIAHESTLVTGLTHKDGTISMARLAPGTARADFFIIVGDQPSFDADPKADGDKDGFAAFGQVVDGMDVVQAIFHQPVSPTAGTGVMRGEMLGPPVTILTARRT